MFASLAMHARSQLNMGFRFARVQIKGIRISEGLLYDISLSLIVCFELLLSYYYMAI